MKIGETKFTHDGKEGSLKTYHFKDRKEFEKFSEKRESKAHEKKEKMAKKIGDEFYHKERGERFSRKK